ncbi:MAG TPA: SRPBCC family protein [Acidimicrobiales bacterium]|nr:SRPBCC family protein [Acidimicrobiales bacterium]
MAANAAVLEAPSRAVFATLSDPGAYPSFVVGTRSTRRFDPSWPEVGSVLHHSQGMGPLVVRSHTEVIEVEQDRLLVLRAHLGPLGVHHVRFSLTPAGAGTRVEIDEHAIEGASAALWNPLTEALMSLRNRELLRRLGAVAKRRCERQKEFDRS